MMSENGSAQHKVVVIGYIQISLCSTAMCLTAQYVRDWSVLIGYCGVRSGKFQVQVVEAGLRVCLMSNWRRHRSSFAAGPRQSGHKPAVHKVRGYALVASSTLVVQPIASLRQPPLSLELLHSTLPCCATLKANSLSLTFRGVHHAFINSQQHCSQQARRAMPGPICAFTRRFTSSRLSLKDSYAIRFKDLHFRARWQALRRQ